MTGWEGKGGAEVPAASQVASARPNRPSALTPELPTGPWRPSVPASKRSPGQVVTMRMLNHRIASALVTAAFCTTPAAVFGQASNDARTAFEQLPAEANAVWEKATSPEFTSECLIRRVEQSKGGRSVYLTKLRICKSGPCYLWSYEHLGSDDPDTRYLDASRVACVNTRYEFKLQKRSGKPDWLLLDWKFAGEEKPSYRSPVKYDAAGCEHFEHLTLARLPLGVAVREAGWRLKSVRPSPAGGGLLRVEFDLRSKPKPQVDEVRSGWLDLDPSSGWCIRESDISLVITVPDKAPGSTFQVKSSFRSRYDIVSDARGVPILKADRFEGVSETAADGKTHVERTSEFTTTYQDEVPEREFTLSAFGLPEPEGVAWDRPTPTYVWILTAAGACAVLAFGVRLLARRKAQPQPV